MSKILVAAKCSQMSNPKAGTGSGGDRCVEATCAMIDATYKYGPKAAAGADPETLMADFVQEWNGTGAVNSAMEPNSRIDDFLKEYDITVNAVSGFFSNVQQIVDRGHIAYTQVNDYRKLELLGGGNPYQWDAASQPAAGHMLLVVGYGNGVVVHDPLRAIGGMPAEYSVTAFEAAGWNTIGEIMGAALSDGTPSPGPEEHVIKGGETLWALTDGNMAWIDAIIAANPGLNPRMLHIGSTIIIPPEPKA